MSHRIAALFTVALLAVGGLIGIAGSRNGGAQGPVHRGGPDSYGDVISHIFIIVQENRSLNNLFAGANIPGANTTLSGWLRGSSGLTAQVQLAPAPLATSLDIDHCYYDAAVAIDGANKPMDGFNRETLLPNGSEICGKGSQIAGTIPYAYVRQQDVQPYWDIANAWVLAANFYPTELGPSFVAHLNLIAGTTEYQTKPDTAVADFPNGTWGCGAAPGTTTRWLTAAATPGPYTGPSPCYDQFHTMADLLDCIYCLTSRTQTPVAWRYYAPGVTTPGGGYIWSAFQAIKRVYDGSDWKTDIVTPPPQILSDIPDGKLDNVGVTWVVPEDSYSDHAGTDTDEGPSWVGDIVNEIGARPQLWNSSVIIILWDDWGGWYDNVAPPTLDFRGYGIRTPMLILSPYAKQEQDNGHVTLRQFEAGSILKFIEQVFNLPDLASLPCGRADHYVCDVGYTDNTANSIGYVLDTTQSPRPFGTPIRTKYDPSFFKKGGAGYRYTSAPPDGE